MVWSYHILSHPADVKLEITATSLKDLFQAALLGMAAILQPSKPNKRAKVKETIEIKSLDLDSLLVDFLNEVLAKSEILKAAFNTLIIKKLTTQYLQAEIMGYNIDSWKQGIKAATHHGLKITKDKQNNYQVTILFDI